LHHTTTHKIQNIKEKATERLPSSHHHHHVVVVAVVVVAVVTASCYFNVKALLTPNFSYASP